MKFLIPQGDLNRCLSIAGKSLLAKVNLPILSTVLIKTTKNKLELVSTNLETATLVTVNCTVEQEGTVATGGRTLLEFVSQLGDSEVSVEKLGEELVVSTKTNSARVPTMPIEDFPVIPKITDGLLIKLKIKDFIKAVLRVAFCAASDEGRPILTGVLVELGKQSLTMVATDGYRLGYVKIPAEVPKLEALKINVPARAIIEVVKIIEEMAPRDEQEKTKEDEDEIAIVVAKNTSQVVFKVGEVEFTSRLIEGEYPNWQKIIPVDFKTRVKLIKLEFGKLVRIASIFARDSGNIVRLKFDNAQGKKLGLLEVSANTNQVGSSESQMEVEMSGKGGEIAFNFRYLLEVLSIIEEDEIYFEMIESLNPGRITAGADSRDFFHIIMPVRLQV